MSFLFGRCIVRGVSPKCKKSRVQSGQALGTWSSVLINCFFLGPFPPGNQGLGSVVSCFLLWLVRDKVGGMGFVAGL